MEEKSAGRRPESSGSGHREKQRSDQPPREERRGSEPGPVALPQPRTREDGPAPERPTQGETYEEELARRPRRLSRAAKQLKKLIWRTKDDTRGGSLAPTMDSTDHTNILDAMGSVEAPGAASPFAGTPAAPSPYAGTPAVPSPYAGAPAVPSPYPYGGAAPGGVAPAAPVPAPPGMPGYEPMMGVGQGDTQKTEEAPKGWW